MALKTLIKAAAIAGIATLYFNRRKATGITDPDGASTSPATGDADSGSADLSPGLGSVGQGHTASGSSVAGGAGPKA